MIQPLKRQSGSARSICQRFNATMIFEPTAIERYLSNTQLQRPLGNQATDRPSRIYITRIPGSAKTCIQRRSAGQHTITGMACDNQLGINMPRSPENAKSV